MNESVFLFFESVCVNVEAGVNESVSKSVFVFERVCLCLKVCFCV